MEPISPPIDLYSLPKELDEYTALNLSYDDILNLCKTSKRYLKICNNPKFWRAKLIKEFPEENISKLTGPQYRAYYEHLLSEEYQNEAVDLKFNMLSDPKVEEFNNKIKEIVAKSPKWKGSDISKMKIGPALTNAKRIPEAKPLLDDRKKVLENIEKQIKGTQRKADELNIRYRKVFPIVYTPKYFHIIAKDKEYDLIDKLEESLPLYTTVNVNKPLDRPGIEENDLNRLLFPIIKEPVKEGFIIHFDPENPANDEIVLYVYSYNNRLYGEIERKPPQDPRFNSETLPEHLLDKFSDEEGGDRFDKLYPNFDIDW